MSNVAVAYAQMLTKSPDVPEHVIAGLLASRADAVEPLLAIAGDRSLDAAGLPNQGTARAHAVEMLGHLGEAAAIPGLLDLLVRDRQNSRLVGTVADALSAIGGVTDDALAKLASTSHLHERMMLAMVLASAGEHHDAIRDVLRELLPQDPDIVLPLIATYGDPALAPDVAETLLGASGPRIMQAVHTLRKLGFVHPKLDDLAAKVYDTARYEVSRQLLLDLAPDLALLAR